jgi:hypothetical protein
LPDLYKGDGVMARAKWPHCAACAREARETWNGRHPEAAGGAEIPLAVAYVRVRGTSGLYRHLCADCLARTGDTLITQLAQPCLFIN